MAEKFKLEETSAGTKWWDQAINRNNKKVEDVINTIIDNDSTSGVANAELVLKVNDIESALEVANSELNDIAINIKSFGAVGDCGGWSNFNVITGTDDTIAFKNAINSCIANGTTLILEPNKKYRITDTLTINGILRLNGNKSQLIADIQDKNKPLIEMINNDAGKIENIKFVGNCLCKTAIQFTKPDSQMVTLENLNIQFFRYGLYTSAEETINRIELNKCEILNNIIAGIWFESYAPHTVYTGQSAPITIKDTLIHGNSIAPYMRTDNDGTTRTQNGIQVITDEVDSYQVYLSGITNCLITGGQLTCGTTLVNKHLLYGFYVDNISIVGTDLEQAHLSDTNGVEYSDYNSLIGTSNGGIICIENSRDIHINTNGGFHLYGDSVIKLINCKNTADITGIYKDSVLYSIDIVDSNENSDDVNAAAYKLRLSTNSLLSDLSPNAIFSLGKERFDLLSNIKNGLTTYYGTDLIFTNSVISNDKYLLKNIGSITSPTFDNCCYIKKFVENPSVIVVLVECDWSEGTGTGRFFVEALNSDNTREEFWICDPTVYQRPVKTTRYKRYVFYTTSKKIKSIRYGFGNLGSDGYINDTTVGKDKGFKIFLGYDSPFSDFDTSNKDNRNNRGLDFVNLYLGSSTSAPSWGTFRKGCVKMNSNPSMGTYSGWICVADGSPGTWIGFGQIGIIKDSTANRPTTGVYSGYKYLDTTLASNGKLIIYNGSNWVDSTGIIV